MPVDLKLSLKDLAEMDLMMSGEAARVCGVDRRTFWKKVAEGKIKPVATMEGKAVYERSDVERLAAFIKKEKREKQK